MGKLLVLSICQLLVFVLAERKYKLCVAERMAKYNQKGSCQDLADNEHSEVECVIAKDRLECLRHLNTSSADFTVIHPEELVLANNMGVPIKMTHELRKFKNVPSVDYSVIGLVSSRISVESLADLHNVQMCSVGFDVAKGHDFDWNEVFSKYIEDLVVQQQCHANMSLAESRIASLESYFGSSCKAGKWVPDPHQDQQLKQKYPGLCSLCDDPASCSSKDKYWGRRGVAYCMTDCLGDVAWMRLDDWRVHEETVTNKACGDFFFLCPDGRVQLTSTPDPCTWVSQPLPTISIRPALSQTLTHFLTEVGTSLPTPDPTASWRWVARNLISPYSRYIVPLENELTPNYYLAKANNYLSAADDESGCDYSHHTIRFCTEPGQARSKCDQLGHIAKAYGVGPALECTSPGRGEPGGCEALLGRGEADVMSVKTDHYADVLRQNPNLKPVLYQLGEQRRHAVAVVKKSSHITSFAQLRNKRACFGMVDDLGWNAVLYQLLKEDLLPRVCPYEEAMKQFFGAICAIYSPNPSIIRQCDGNVEQGRNMAYEQAEVMECLAEGGGDVVFLDLRNLIARREHEWYFKSSNYAFSTLCPPDVPGVTPTSNTSCPLLRATQGQLLVPANMSQSRSTEISNTFRQFGAYFGFTVKTLGTPAESFKLFAGFDGVDDVLFQDDARSLSPPEMIVSTDRTYEHVLPLFSKCDPNVNLVSPNTGSVPQATVVLTVTFSIASRLVL